MNRRQMLAAGALLPLATKASATAQQATPTTGQPDTETIDARLVSSLVQQVTPYDLLMALESSPVETSVLIEANNGTTPAALPWSDFSDTDLINSLGGVIIVQDPEDEDSIVGGYIVYDSPEIAYLELVRKLGSNYDDPSATRPVNGTAVWALGSPELPVAVGRVGNVMILGLFSEQSETMSGIIIHLGEVAAKVAG